MEDELARICDEQAVASIQAWRRQALSTSLLSASPLGHATVAAMLRRAVAALPIVADPLTTCNHLVTR